MEVKIEKTEAILSFHSPFGISQATIERTDENWPNTVALRLHLNGLSSFRASNGKVRIDASASVQDGKPKVRIWKDGKEDSLLDSKNPYWLEIRIFGGDGKLAKNIPLKDGYFDVRMPTAFFEGNPKTITVNWIDFYRN